MTEAPKDFIIDDEFANTMNTYYSVRKSCPVCNSVDIDVIVNHVFEAFEDEGYIGKYDISVCNQCGMLFANNIPSQESADNYYLNESKYETASVLPIVNDYYLFCSRCVCEISSSDDKIMDTGSGYGDVLRELRKRGYTNLTAIDTSPTNINSLSDFGIKGFANSIFDVNTANLEKQNLIICMGVLEHIVDLRGAINKISTLVVDNGLLFIAVPDAKQFLASADSPFQQFSVEHINFFDISSLNLFLMLGGFELQKQWDFPGFITAVYKKTTRRNAHIIEYIDICNKKIDSILCKVEGFINSSTPVVVWGAGTLSRYLLANTEFSKLNISAFVDSNVHYQGRYLAGKPVVAPCELRDDRYREMPILVSTYVHGEEIRAAARNELCLNNDIYVLLEE